MIRPLTYFDADGQTVIPGDVRDGRFVRLEALNLA